MERLILYLEKISYLFGRMAEDEFGHSPKNNEGLYGIDLDPPWFNSPNIIKDE